MAVVITHCARPYTMVRFKEIHGNTYFYKISYCLPKYTVILATVITNNVTGLIFYGL